MQKQKILFVCHGNICRSPMAEYIMKHLAAQSDRADDFEIASAAVSREEIGNDIYPAAKHKLHEKGIPFSRHIARQITPADYDYYDRILVMDSSNLRGLQHIIPADPQHKIATLLSLLGDTRDIADPWYTGNFETAFLDISSACLALLR